MLAALLLYSALETLFSVFYRDGNMVTGTFGIVIIIPLGISIFDLGKTILEEEVLVNKNIHHHDSTRHTIS